MPRLPPYARTSMLGGLAAGALCLSASAWAGAAPTAAGALDRLPGEVAGVVGSGNQISLRLRRDGAAVTLKLGDEYRDGWRLRALTPDVATLVRNGETRRVGLNPSGALAVEAEAGRATVVTSCLSNVCGGRQRGAPPRNAVRVNAAIRAGDAGAALAAGGDGRDVLSAWAAADGGNNAMIQMMQTGAPVLEAIDRDGEITIRSTLPNGRDLILRREPSGPDQGGGGPGG